MGSNNRLNGKFSNNGHGSGDEPFEERKEILNYDAEDHGRAVDLASSIRGQWIIGMALYRTLKDMEGEVEKAVSVDAELLDETAEGVLIRADMQDMETLITQLFPLYKNVIEREEELGDGDY